MKPFILSQHEKADPAVRELRETELQHVSGGVARLRQRDPIKLNTVTVTPNHDGGDDGTDEG